MIEYLEDYQYGWVIDVWSLGIVLLEFFLGYPLALRPEKVCI
jgi:serine/threonine protein kinase